MIRRKCRILAALSAVALSGVVATVSGDEVVIPGETYTPDLIALYVIDSYAERQAQGGSAGDPVEGGPCVPRAPAPEPLNRETIPQAAGDLTGTPPTLGPSRRGARSEDTLNQCFSGVPCIPPDTMGAVGPNHFVQVINGNVSIFQKSDGVRIATEGLASFFRDVELGPQIRDPRVVSFGRGSADSQERRHQASCPAIRNAPLASSSPVGMRRAAIPVSSCSMMFS